MEKLLTNFWSMKYSLSNITWYLFWGSWVAQMSSLIIPHTPAQVAILDITMWTCFLINSIRSLYIMRRQKKELNNQLFELKVESIIIQRELERMGLTKEAKSIEESRRNVLNKL